MPNATKFLALCLVGAAALVHPRDAKAASISLQATYYTVAGTYNGPGSGDPDFNTIGCCTATFTDEVQSTVGALGLPVYNTSSSAPFIHDTLADGEITWWSPTLNANVVQTGSALITTPFQNFSFYPPNGTGTDDAHGFQAATFTGAFTLTAPESISFSLGADDDAFLSVDGTIVAQEGGIHGVSAAASSSATLGIGAHTIELFYVDRNVTGAGLYFDITTQDITVTPPVVTPPPVNPPTGVPEPMSIALLGAGLIGVAVTRMRRHSVALPIEAGTA